MKRKYNILILVLILIAVGGFVLYSSGVKISYFENYGTNFRKNVKNIADRLNIDLPQGAEEFLSKTPEPLTTEEKLEIIEKMEKENAEALASPTPTLPIATDKELLASSKIVAFKNAYAAEYAVYNSKLLCATDTQLVCYKHSGDVEWSVDIQANNPILRVSGNYIMLAEKGGSKAYLFNGKKKLWENSLEEVFISADVSSNGDVCIVSDKSKYKGAVSVINRNGDVVFQWNSGKHEIIDADICSSSRNLAISLLNTEKGADTKISFFDLKQKESFKTLDLEDSIAFDLEFGGGVLNIFADNQILGVSSSGNILWTKSFEQKSLYRYAIEDSGYKLCVFDNNNLSEISIINSRGKEKATFESEAFPEHICVMDGRVLYSNGRTLIYSAFSGKNPQKYKCTRDIYKLLILDSRHLFAVYNSSIEFINLK